MSSGAAAPAGGGGGGTLRSGAPKKGAPKHQNRYAFKHNPNSKKTKRIMQIQHGGLCTRCKDQIEWRKKYRKYKPLKAPAVCAACHEKTVKKAYHFMCDKCASERGVCSKCMLDFETAEARRLGEEGKPKSGDGASVASVMMPKPPTREELAMMRERERRAALRKYERDRQAARRALRGEVSGDEEEEGEGDVEMKEGAAKPVKAGVSSGAGAARAAAATSMDASDADVDVDIEDADGESGDDEDGDGDEGHDDAEGDDDDDDDDDESL